MSIDLKNATFDFSETFQEAIIGHCMKSNGFFRKAEVLLKPNYFSANIRLATLFKQLIEGARTYKECVNSPDELKNLQYFRELKADEREHYYNTIDRCYHLSTQSFSINKMEIDLTGFLRVSMFKEAVTEAAGMYKKSGNNSSKLENAYDWTLGRIELLRKTTFLNEDRVDKYDDAVSWFKDRQELNTVALSTGSKNLDDMLGGGLFRQDNTALMAASNQGKTRTLITLARHAIHQGKYVLLITHEGVPASIKETMLLSFIGITKQTATKWVDDPEKAEIIRIAGKALDKYFYFMPFNKAGQMFVEDVVYATRELHTELSAKNGYGFDLIVDDYPKKLRLRSRMNSKEGLFRAELAEIYDYFVQLAIELNCHVTVAIQTNRAGLKKSKMVGKEDQSALGLEDTDEAFGIAQNMGNVISLMRTPEDKANNIARFNVIKSRNGETDQPMYTRTAYGSSIVYGDYHRIMPISGRWMPDVPNGNLMSYMPGTTGLDMTVDIDSKLKTMEAAFVPQKDENGNDTSHGEYIIVENGKNRRRY